MENLKRKAREMIKGKNRSIQTWQMVLACALLAALVVLLSPIGTRVALANPSGGRGHTVDVTFTKWITTFPAMAGTVGGDVGTGTFAGEIEEYLPGTEITTIKAVYHINGGRHAFSANVVVTQNETTHTATITGVVTDGWQKGKQVLGNYAVISCSASPDGVCFQGVLYIRAGSRHHSGNGR